MPSVLVFPVTGSAYEVEAANPSEIQLRFFCKVNTRRVDIRRLKGNPHLNGWIDLIFDASSTDRVINQHCPAMTGLFVLAAGVDYDVEPKVSRLIDYHLAFGGTEGIPSFLEVWSRRMTRHREAISLIRKHRPTNKHQMQRLLDHLRLAESMDVCILSQVELHRSGFDQEAELFCNATLLLYDTY